MVQQPAQSCERGHKCKRFGKPSRYPKFNWPFLFEEEEKRNSQKLVVFVKGLCTIIPTQKPLLFYCPSCIIKLPASPGVDSDLLVLMNVLGYLNYGYSSFIKKMVSWVWFSFQKYLKIKTESSLALIVLLRSMEGAILGIQRTSVRIPSFLFKIGKPLIRFYFMSASGKSGIGRGSKGPKGFWVIKLTCWTIWDPSTYLIARAVQYQKKKNAKDQL